MKQFEKKFKDKSGIAWANRGDNPKPGKYAFVERNYEDDSDDEDAAEDESKDKTRADDWTPPKCSLDPAVQHLLELIFNQQYFANTMSDLNYDANKLPLGKLSKATITRGFQSLKDLSELLDDNTLAQSKYSMTYGNAVEQLSNTFYSLIPHNFGRNRPPVIHTQQMVKKEIELLESLSDMKNAAEIMKLDKVGNYDVHPLDKQYEGLKMKEMTVLDPATQEFAELKNYLVNTRGHTHNHSYQVENIFRIERQGEKDRFDASVFGKLNQNRRLLWHGSRATNFGGILSQGLRIAPPEAPVNGYMFDKGIYLADMASKSANYCCSYQSGNTALLLLCEAELGDPMQELLHSSYNAASEAKQKGMISTWGKGTNGPLAWKDASCVEPSLKGVMMVSIGEQQSGPSSLLANHYQFHSPTRPQRCQGKPAWQEPACCITNTLPTTCHKSASVTSSGLRCRSVRVLGTMSYGGSMELVAILASFWGPRQRQCVQGRAGVKTVSVSGRARDTFANIAPCATQIKHQLVSCRSTVLSPVVRVPSASIALSPKVHE